jgi:hypothetical protein
VRYDIDESRETQIRYCRFKNAIDPERIDMTDILHDRLGVSSQEAITSSVPWAGAAGSAVAESVPVVKFASVLLTNLTKEHDPDTLGFLACTLAYQLNGAGYSEASTRELLNRVHRRFVGNLKTILSDGKLKERFDPFTQRIELDTAEELSYDAILSHINHQRWLFEEAPVFRKEPFALADVYVDSECGSLSWGEIQAGADACEIDPARRQNLVDPFSEGHGGRYSLLETVLALMGDSSFTEAIVIQGVAGSGKSSFTLKLCSTLEKEGLYPIRVRLRDLPLDRHITDALSKAMFPPERDLAPTSRGRSCDNPSSAARSLTKRLYFAVPESARTC